MVFFGQQKTGDEERKAADAGKGAASTTNDLDSQRSHAVFANSRPISVSKASVSIAANTMSSAVSGAALSILKARRGSRS